MQVVYQNENKGSSSGRTDSMSFVGKRQKRNIEERESEERGRGTTNKGGEKRPT